jgi:putative membrane protein
MALHIATMNVLAPLAAVFLLRRFPAICSGATAKGLWLATLLQMGLLWAWHSPPVYSASAGSMPIEIAAHAALFLSALLFWTSVVASPSPWSAMLALLVNGKLACLLGALLIFAPRVLICTSQPDAALSTVGIDDQHLAGLLMIAACPLSYVLTAVLLAGHTLLELERRGGRPIGAQAGP